MARDNFEQNEKERKKRWKGIVQEENPNKAVEIGVVGLGPLLYAETTCAFSYVDARCTQHYCWCTQHFNGKDKNNPGIF